MQIKWMVSIWNATLGGKIVKMKISFFFTQYILRKFCKKTSFHWPMFFRIKTIHDFVLIWENTGQRKPVFSHILYSGKERTVNFLEISIWKIVCRGFIFNTARAKRISRTSGPCFISAPPQKYQKTYGFPTFSGGIEMWYWTKMGWCYRSSL